MANVSSDDQCNLAISIVSNAYYRAMLIGEVIVGILAVTPNILLLLVIWKTSVMSANLRLLLAHLSIVFVWFGVGDAVKSMYLLIVHPCSFSMTVRQCKVFDLVTTWLALPNICYSLIPVCIERLYATINYRFYETSRIHRKPWLAGALITCAWTSALGMNGKPLFYLPPDVRIPICDNAFVPSTTNPMLIPVLYLSLEVISSLITIFIYFYNRNVAAEMAINRARYDLSARFQIDQNVKINSIMIPSMILHFAFHLPTFGLATGILILKNPLGLPPRILTSLSKSTFLLRLVYACIHPILVFYCNAHLRSQLSKTAFGKVMTRIGILRGTLEKENSPGVNANTVTHFQYLNQMWREPNVKQKPIVIEKPGPGVE